MRDSPANITFSSFIYARRAFKPHSVELASFCRTLRAVRLLRRPASLKLMRRDVTQENDDDVIKIRADPRDRGCDRADEFRSAAGRSGARRRPRDREAECRRRRIQLAAQAPARAWRESGRAARGVRRARSARSVRSRRRTARARVLLCAVLQEPAYGYYDGGPQPTSMRSRSRMCQHHYAPPPAYQQRDYYSRWGRARRLSPAIAARYAATCRAPDYGNAAGQNGQAPPDRQSGRRRRQHVGSCA